jgi:tRNA pseudouridine38-40 synthase
VKIALVVQYDGTDYHGFEWQSNVPTIQGALEKAIREVTGEQRRIIPASRTDSGVHASGQVVSFWTNSHLEPATFARALSALLPADIAVTRSLRIPDDFSVRAAATGREYVYRISNRPYRSPLERRYSGWVSRPLDISSMNKACLRLIGRHDFTSFATGWENDRDPVQEMFRAEVEQSNEMVSFKVAASAFLPHQVRNTVGLLIRIGLHKVEAEEIERIIEARRPGTGGPTAPACGLCLTKVNYDRPLGE